MEHTLALITLAHQGDKAARDTLIEENIGLVWSIVRRFQNRGVETEDLFQIGSIGLIKAVDKFDPAYQVQFSTYAVPMIAGEIRRFLRDDGMLKVSRSLKELAGRIYSTKDALEKKNGREPTLYEVARELGVSQEDLVLAMEAATQVESLQQVIYQGEGNDISLMDKLEEEENQSDQVVNRLLLEDMLKSLEGRERQLIYMRYFQEKTQAAIAREMGISQVQVSRLEKKILGKLRKKM
ncbi:MAG: RNA polymerase sporulation sigma factor SigF [Clostridiales bacterium]|uniref:RNA polymerase sporulation sigma factor SigF n=1 Tax=Candidatus Pullilachnospira stercoravium TaxID=2840913 RepID=A0A9D1NUE1_9FIRM|nr:RNA polymerase sporulation sigma factor SigF [Clostridiales bacterium]HIV13144.1 RNA polymerase sporulation sigma factor SigF [Candidatus Pullilachnospira stercoravium]